ncbi:hypothetical protein AAVH_16498 [Aphelenchoides avenae]|nr:hypothetical protein AAVH_16498 [Aphelenchus avenae]
MSCMASNTDTGLFRFGGFYRWLVITALVMLAVYAMTGAASVAAITRDGDGVNVVRFTHKFEGSDDYTPVSGLASFWMFSVSALPSTLVTFFVIVNILFLHRAQYFYTALILETVSLIAYFVAPIVITVTTLDYKTTVNGKTGTMSEICKDQHDEVCSTFTSKLNTVLALLWVFSLLGLALRAFYIFVLFKAFRAQAQSDGQSLRSTDTSNANLDILPTASNAGIRGIMHRLGSYRWLVITALVMLVVHAMTGAASLAAFTRRTDRRTDGTLYTSAAVLFMHYYGSYGRSWYGVVAGMDCFWIFSLSAIPSVLVTLFALVNIIFLQRALFYLTALVLEAVSLLIYFVSPIVVTVMTTKHPLCTSNRDITCKDMNRLRGQAYEDCATFNSAMTTIFALLWTFWILGLVLRVFYIYQLFVAYKNQKNRQPRL